MTSARARRLVVGTDVFSQHDLGSELWLECVARLTRVLGRRSFGRELLELLNRVLPIDHCVVFTYSEDGLGHLFTHGRMRADRARALAEDYIHRFHERDPMFARLIGALQPAHSPDSARPHPVDLHSSYDPAYRNHFFDRNDLIDKTSTVARVECGSVLCNFYRMATSGPYSGDDSERLGQILPLVTAFISAHYQLACVGLPDRSPKSSVSHTRSLVHTIVGKRTPPFDRLTQRESEVCERIVLGYTSIGIGLDLNIALSSVLTYRKRAYEKLSISAQNELFALCLGATRRTPTN